MMQAKPSVKAELSQKQSAEPFTGVVKGRCCALEILCTG